jgi:hypothetical protein
MHAGWRAKRPTYTFPLTAFLRSHQFNPNVDIMALTRKGVPHNQKDLRLQCPVVAGLEVTTLSDGNAVLAKVLAETKKTKKEGRFVLKFMSGPFGGLVFQLHRHEFRYPADPPLTVQASAPAAHKEDTGLSSPAAAHKEDTGLSSSAAANLNNATDEVDNLMSLFDDPPPSVYASAAEAAEAVALKAEAKAAEAKAEAAETKAAEAKAEAAEAKAEAAEAKAEAAEAKAEAAKAAQTPPPAALEPPMGVLTMTPGAIQMPELTSTNTMSQSTTTGLVAMAMDEEEASKSRKRTAANNLVAAMWNNESRAHNGASNMDTSM